MDQKPKDPCYICRSTDWWFRMPSHVGEKGEWLCPICHPNPNGTDTKKQELEMLKERVRGGLLKMNQALGEINKMVPEDTDPAYEVKNKAWKAQMDRWVEAGKKMDVLLEELNYKYDFNECVFLDPKTGKPDRHCLGNNPDGFTCWRCSASRKDGPKYWEDELMNSPRGEPEKSKAEKPWEQTVVLPPRKEKTLADLPELRPNDHGVKAHILSAKELEEKRAKAAITEIREVLKNQEQKDATPKPPEEEKAQQEFQLPF